jgi:predicted dehydrogenase
MSLSRRRFLQGSAVTTAALGMPLLASSRVRAANDEIGVAILGLGGRGRSAHIPRMGSQPGVRIVAVCDPDGKALDQGAAVVAKLFHYQPEKYSDVRKLLERKDIQVLSNATQNYWHVLSTIWACQAGKHVYCEKPVSHYIWEGRQMVNAARKYGRLVQTGTQQRSRPATREAIAWLQAGNLGRVRYVTCFANKPRKSVGKRSTPLPIPASVDFDLWCGPVQKRPIYRDRLQYDCSFDFHTGGGEYCNQGVHELDVARWLLGEKDLPRRVMSLGGRFTFNDAADAPNTQIVCLEFASAPVLYEVHNLMAGSGSKLVPDFRGHRVGVVADCEGGSLAITQEYARALDPKGQVIKSWKSDETNFQTLINAVRSGRREDLTSEILEGHLSTRLCHVGNISHRLGTVAGVAEQRRAVQEVPAYAEMHERFLQHLAANRIDPGTATLGPWLECDSEHECFHGNAAANKLVRGSYREPFVVPEISPTSPH